MVAPLPRNRRGARIQGDGDPAVLLPDFGFGDSHWEAVITLLSRSMQILQYDRGGATDRGATDGPDGRLAQDRLELVSLLHDLDYWPVHLIGVGYGGRLALEVARESPEMVRGMLLHEPWIRYRSVVGVARTKTDGPIRSRLRFPPGIPPPGEPAPPWSVPGSDPLQEWKIAATAMGRAEDPTAVDWDEKASSDIYHPILVTAGAGSPADRRVDAYDLVGQLPNARFLLLPGVGSQPQCNAPDLFVAVVSGFLTERSLPSD
jgi:pimeloyl-ACP methyl ester carboxylesterase